MLLRFKVRNLRSIRDQQELSLVASALRDEAGSLIDTPIAGVRAVPSVLIYGANASGKSNLVLALGWMRDLVLYSQNRGRPGAGVPRQPFRLDPEVAHAPTAVEIDFIQDGVHHRYGFEATDREIVTESLFALPNNRRQLLFERTGSSFEFGRHLKGRTRTIAELTRPDSLYLSAAMQNAHEELTSVGAFFRDLEVHRDPEDIGFRVARFLKQVEGRGLDRQIVDLLDHLGTGVIGHRIVETEVPVKQREFLAGLTDLLKILEPGAGVAAPDGMARRLQLAHHDSAGDSQFFDLSDESEGTRRLLFLIAGMFSALERGATMVIDELDASLHTKACETLLALFASRATNPRGAQLIATTHDTNLLHSNLLRRDQIWFTEKDRAGATSLYPLTDIRTRKHDNIARGYLQGRYGAVPFAGPVADLLQAD